MSPTASPTKKLWYSLAAIVIASFGLLLYMGGEIYRSMPPIPARFVTPAGETLYTGEDIRTGQQVWQSTGGHQQGSVWGHGAYVAPDWSADWLHRMSVAQLDAWAKAETGSAFADLDPAQREGLRARLQSEVRANTYDAATDTVMVSHERAAAIREVAAHYDALFSADPALQPLREAYAIRENPVPDAEHRRQLGAFLFWSAWAAGTERPDDDRTYTSNWPAEDLIGNRPTTEMYLWTFLSVLGLLAGVGALTWHYAATRTEDHAEAPASDPLAGLVLTPSMKATLKYFWVVAALFAVQVLLGAITAHYAVEGQGFYGFNLSEVLPYAVTRTWHIQLAVFWIATAWLATGLFIAPAISGHEPRFQKLGVDFLFLALLIVVVGSMTGEWFGVMQKLGLDANFWFGHQGWEFVDLGRFWQILLTIGLALWLLLVGRALWPAVTQESEGRPLVVLLFLSTIAIGLMYGAGLMWGKHSHLSMVEYWRWWVVHLWVEGFFEVFATAVIAFLFTRLGLVRTGVAVTSVLFATIIFLTGGVLGTFHHLYFTGTPTGVLALGAVFSALEVVPLVLIGYEAYENYVRIESRDWVRGYKWPIMFFVAVAFWNLVGAGLFGFLINPPIALYFMQGLNTTPLHGHTALFGVYGMLGIGLMLFCLRSLQARAAWDDGVLRWSFWSLNLGLAAMALMSLAPYGLLQVWAAIEHGYWYARSAEFIHQPIMHTLVWLRVPGDILFGLGTLGVGWFVAKLALGARAQGPASVASTKPAR
jgi:nitric oxide reductase subunit B